MTNKNSCKTCAIVVTYNRLELLKRCISALKNQTKKIDNIIVINNGSTDGTKHWIENDAEIIVINQENVGGSGGFNKGCLYAIENGFDYIWLMDDDGYPSPNAFEELFNVPILGASVLNSLVVDEHMQKLSFPVSYLRKNYTDYKGIVDLNIKYIIGSINPFNGTLISKEVIDLIGIPYGDMFIWGDESEYVQRVIKQNIPVITVVSSIFHHPIAKNIEGAEWDNSNTWKQYYSTRNMYRTMYTMNKRFVFLRYTISTLRLIKLVIVQQKKNKWRKINILIKAYFDAIHNKFGKLPHEVKCLKYFLK